MLDCTSLRQFSTLWWPGDFSLQWDASPQATGITLSKSQSFTCFLWGIILFLCWPAVPGSQVVVYSAAARVSFGGFRSLLLLRSWLGVCCKPRPGFCTQSSSWTLFLLHLRQISSQFWPLLSEELFSPFSPSQPSIASAGWGGRSPARFPHSWGKLPQAWWWTHTHQLPLLNPSKSFYTTVNNFTFKQCHLTLYSLWAVKECLFAKQYKRLKRKSSSTCILIA